MHRGRFQAQGGIEKSEPWTKKDPLPYAEGKSLLHSLKNQLTTIELSERNAGINLCSTAIANMHSSGGYTVTTKPYKKSFPNGHKKRIDLEIQKGTAFV